MKLPALSGRVYVNIACFMASVALLLYPAFINGYPLVYTDSGTYIYVGFSNQVPIDRPIVYPLFVRHISLAYSLWLVVTAQAMIITSLFVILYRHLLSVKLPYVYSLVTIGLLAVSTGISNYTSQIMPDIFTPAAFMSLGMLVALPDAKLYVKGWLGGVLLFSNMAHTSTLLTTTTVAGILIVLYPFIAKAVQIRIRQVLLSLAIVLSGWLALSSLNYIKGVGFSISRAPNVFIMGRVVESGVARMYLEDNCGSAYTPLCASIDSLPVKAWHFAWFATSPLYKGKCSREWTSCWTEKNKEYKPIVAEVFTNIRYLRPYTAFVIRETYKQLLDFGTGYLDPMRETSPVYGPLKHYFSREFPQYAAASQYKERFTADTTNAIQRVLVPISFLCFMIIMFIPRIRKMLPRSIHCYWIVIVCGMIVNAAVCAAFSAVVDRYQGRVIWLLPMMVLIIAGYCLDKYWQGRKEYTSVKGHR